MHVQKSLIAIVLCMFSLIAFSQNTLSIDQVIHNKMIKQGSINDLYFLGKESIIDRFSEKEFIDGAFRDAQLLDSSNKLYEVKARYNLHRDEVQILFNEKINILYPHLVQAIQIGQTVFSPQLIEKNGEKDYSYLQIKVVGKISLYKKNTKKEEDHKPVIFIKNAEGHTTIIKPKRKNILSLLVDNGEKVERFVIENNLNYGELEDLQEIFNYYNSL